MKRKSDRQPHSRSERILERILNQCPDFSKGESRLTFDMDQGMLIEGVRDVREYTSERLIISTYNKNIIIEGCELCIGCMMRDSMLICGRIFSVKML